jgi:molybdenum cofactor cytidylyltransferase
MPYRNDTVRLGLEALKKNINNCMFCPSDQPLLSGDTIRNMVNKANELPDFIWRLSYGDKVGAPIIFPAWSFSELKNLPEKKGGGAVISKYPGSVRLYNASSEYELMDVDSPEDLIHIKEYQYSCP